MDEPFYTVRGYERRGQEQKSLTSAMEDYVEMICRLSRAGTPVHTGALCELLHVAPPSATRMVHKLRELGLVDSKKYGAITLTEEGRRVGAFLLTRHGALEAFLAFLGVREGLLTETELIEHNVSDATLEKIVLFNRFVLVHPDLAECFEAFCAEQTQQ